MKSINVNSFKGMYLILVFISVSVALWRTELFFVNYFNAIKWILFLGIIPIALLETKKINIKINVILLSLLSFITITCFSTLRSSHLNLEGVFFLVGYLILFLVGFIIVISDELESLLHDALKITVFVCFFISVTQYFNVEGWENGRFRGIFYNTNYLGWVTVFVILHALQSLFKSPKLIHALILLLSILIIFSVQSRAAYLGGVIGIFCICSLNYKKVKLSHAIAFVVVLLLVMLNNFSGNENIIQRELIYGLDQSRTNILNIHLDKLSGSPLFGVGLSESEFGGRYASELAYSDILSFSGILGFISLLTALIITSLYIFQSTNDYQKMNATIFIVILAMSVGDGYISNIGNPLPIFAWIYMGIISRKRSV